MLPRSQLGGMVEYPHDHYDPRINYYREFWNIFVKNEQSINEIRQLTEETTKLTEQLTNIEVDNNIT